MGFKTGQGGPWKGSKKYRRVINTLGHKRKSERDALADYIQSHYADEVNKERLACCQKRDSDVEIATRKYAEMRLESTKDIDVKIQSVEYRIRDIKRELTALLSEKESIEKSVNSSRDAVLADINGKCNDFLEQSERKMWDDIDRYLLETHGDLL